MSGVTPVSQEVSDQGVWFRVEAAGTASAVRRAAERLADQVELAVSVGVAVGVGQQKVPFSGAIPLAPTGLAGKPLLEVVGGSDPGQAGAHDQDVEVAVLCGGRRRHADEA